MGIHSSPASVGPRSDELADGAGRPPIAGLWGSGADGGWTRRIRRALAVSFLPYSCACGHRGVHLCDECAAVFYEGPVRVDSACEALQIAQGNPQNEEEYYPLVPVTAVGEYSGALRAVVLDFKNGGHFVLASFLASRLAEAAALMPCLRAHPHVVVSAPSTMRAVRKRGEDHMRLVADHLCREWGQALRMVPAPRLWLRGHTQHSLNRRDRAGVAARVIIGRVRAWEPYRGWHVIVLDDVVTTGHTLRLLHTWLEERGMYVCGAITLASARIPAKRTLE